MERRFTPVRTLLALVATALLALFWLTPFQAGQFYDYLDNFSGYVVRGDSLATRDGLKELDYFYKLNNNLRFVGLDWVANKYFFGDATRHQAAFDYLTGNYDKVLDELKDDDSSWACYMKANSKWRKAQGVFAHALTLKGKDRNDAMKKADEMAESTKDDYEKAMKNDPVQGLGPRNEFSWDYDMTTDPEARAKGLMPKPPKIKIPLGESENKDKKRGGKGIGKPSPEGGPDNLDQRGDRKDKGQGPPTPPRRG